MSNIVMGTKGSFGRLMSYHFDRSSLRQNQNYLLRAFTDHLSPGQTRTHVSNLDKKLCNFLSKNSVEKKWILAIKDDK